MSNQYSNIPSFDLYDICKLELIWVGKQLKEVVVHTIVTFSISYDGNLIRDEHLNPSNTPYYRSLIDVDDHEKYLQIKDGNVVDWDWIECKNEFLGNHNLKEYNSLLRVAADFKKRLEPIQTSDFAQQVFQYFIQVQLEFENWFFNHDVEYDKSLSNTTTIASGKSKIAPNKKSVKYKKNILREARLFLKIVKEIDNPFPGPSILEEKTGISDSTWSRRFRDKIFLIEVMDLIAKEEPKLLPDSDLSDIYHETQIELSKRLYKKDKKKKNDIIYKGKRNDKKDIQEYPAPSPDSTIENNGEDGEYQASKLLATYKFNLN